ncbi:efflux transporter, RND family, MFP subunit [Psychromonas ingrahamii 37]|uniref:Efflux transporter, RND family, MFP subunit n=1 Tax=Psychromonas ingrahamii (strain DSM 17664 / CCUG 51855 / 37) TaxID=357804 RepID=A1SVM5_PSYIN|nr:acriflavin resistance protein [Psychromonas ingrahamii]ABM03540.1 efflux transporter, RND family, MFP subunit [Psychromonas ingrahamii 37]
MTSNKKRFAFPGIILGAVVLFAAIALKPSPELQENYDKARLVDVMVLSKKNSAPQIIGYGRVAPKHTWQGIAEVKGKIIYRHPDLESGRLIPKGTLVLKIDPLEYQLKIAQAEANLNSSKVQLGRIDQEEQNINASLNIEQQKLTLTAQEYQRKSLLKQKKLISNSDLENEQKLLLAQRSLVQELTSRLALLPDDKKVIKAQISVNQALLADTHRQLEKTHFTLPFDARIADVNIEQAQAVLIGAVLFEAYQPGIMEIKAELSLQDANTLRKSIPAPLDDPLASIAKLNFNASIELLIGESTQHWPAKLTRIAEKINPDQATLGFYLEVKQNIKQLDLSNTLTKGMFVTAKVQGFSSPHFVIPEKALHGDHIYLMDKQNKLQIKPITILFRNAQGVAISGEINALDQLILNDLIPAIAGMSLKIKESDSIDSNTARIQKESVK